MLQRMMGDIVYSELLSKAAQCSSTIEEAAYVAAFSNSPYANTIARTGKPFNPLLFETYECDRRTDPRFGWRVISEQVSQNCCGAVLHMLCDIGESSPSYVCHACRTQRLDLVARIHSGLKVPWQVSSGVSYWLLSPSDAC